VSRRTSRSRSVWLTVSHARSQSLTDSSSVQWLDESVSGLTPLLITVTLRLSEFEWLTRSQTSMSRQLPDSDSASDWLWSEFDKDTITMSLSSLISVTSVSVNPYCFSLWLASRSKNSSVVIVDFSTQCKLQRSCALRHSYTWLHYLTSFKDSMLCFSCQFLIQLLVYVVTFRRFSRTEWQYHYVLYQ